MQEHEEVPRGTHEQNLVNTRAVAEFGIALFLLLALTGVLMWGIFRYFAAREASSEPPPSQLTKSPEQKLPPEPRLQGLPGHPIQPPLEMTELRKAEDAILESYGWVDQPSGVVRIPIDRAMSLIAERSDAGKNRRADGKKD